MNTFVLCPCCGEKVKATTADFADTTFEVRACNKKRADGIVSFTVPKSLLFSVFKSAERPCYVEMRMVAM